jgi:hypothetical protein
LNPIDAAARAEELFIPSSNQLPCPIVMATRPSQIRAYRILSCLAIIHSAVVLGLRFGNDRWSWWWLGLASSLFLWLLVLAIHPGRSILRFLLPTIIAAALFVPCARGYKFLMWVSVEQWLAANNLEKLLRSNPRIILYSIDADYRPPLEVKKGYRQVGADEIILPDDVFTNQVGSFVRMEEAAGSVIASIATSIGKTVNSIADENARAGYGRRWQILRKVPSGSNEPEAEIEAPPEPGPNEFDPEPYKGPAVLGYVEITDRAEQRTLITALASSARYTKSASLCHNPRHGLYVEAGTSTVNLSICFECENVYPFGLHDKMGPFADVSSFAITHAPESVFNATLKRHGVPVPQGLIP